MFKNCGIVLCGNIADTMKLKFIVQIIFFMILNCEIFVKSLLKGRSVRSFWKMIIFVIIVVGGDVWVRA